MSEKQSREKLLNVLFFSSFLSLKRVIKKCLKKHYIRHSTKRVITLVTILFIFNSAVFSFLSTQTVLNTSARSTISRVYSETNITVSKLEAVSNYLLACYYNESGFFTSNPPRQDLNEFYDDVNDLPTPSDFASVRVYKALSALDRISSVDIEKMKNGLIDSLQVGTDGYDYFGPGYLWDFYNILKELDSVDSVPKDNWIEMTLDDYEEESGGFRTNKNGIKSITNSRKAYFLLRELDALDRINWTKTVEYVLSLQLPDGYFQHPLVMGVGLPGPTVRAYSFLNASNNLDFINATKIREIAIDIYNQNRVDAKDSAVINYLVEFVEENGYDFLTFFPDVENLLLEIIEKQNPFYGGFSYSWGEDPTYEENTKAVNSIETSYIIDLIDICDSYNLLSDNITIVYPPLSPYSDTKKVGYALEFSFVFIIIIFCVVVLLKKKFIPQKL
jgi:hypothetical protein